MEPRLLPKISAFLAGVACAFPMSVRVQMAIFVVFLSIDTLTGLWIAARRGQLHSRRLTDKLVSKLLQYTTLVLLFSGAALLAQTWVLINCVLLGITAIEALSNLENLALLALVGGIPVGRFRALIDKVAPFLAVTKGAEEDREAEASLEAHEIGEAGHGG